MPDKVSKYFRNGKDSALLSKLVYTQEVPIPNMAVSLQLSTLTYWTGLEASGSCTPVMVQKLTPHIRVRSPDSGYLHQVCRRVSNVECDSQEPAGPGQNGHRGEALKSGLEDAAHFGRAHPGPTRSWTTIPGRPCGPVCLQVSSGSMRAGEALRLGYVKEKLHQTS